MVEIRKNFDPLDDPQGGHRLSKAIIDTIAEPLIILDENLEIIAASKSFYKKFNLKIDATLHKMFNELGGGQWNIPALNRLLKEVIPAHKVVKNYEINHVFPRLGKCTLLLNAREINYENGRKKMLISIFDVTKERELERTNEKLAEQKDILLKEMRHRIANSLQIIASILLLKAEGVTSKETRFQLEDAHDRIMSIATVQGHLDPMGLGSYINVQTYLVSLCKSLAKSMIGNRRPLLIKVRADAGKVTSNEAIGLGLITTELIINSLKHAFQNQAEGIVDVIYKVNGKNWKLIIKDNGQGFSKKDTTKRKGLGTGIVNSLVKQLEGVISTKSTSQGTVVTITKGN